MVDKMTNNYAIIENAVVVNVANATSEFAQEQGWVPLVGNAGIGWGYVNGQFVPPPGPTPEEIQTKNKQQAQALLSATDWTTIPDVADPAVSNPYLTNAAEFAAWRSQVRAIAVNPPTTQAVFPEQPTEQWSN